MNVQCPSCETVYRIDPAKVPAGGVRARCAVCSFAIQLTPPTEPAVSDERESVDDSAFIAPPPDEGAEGDVAVAEPPVRTETEAETDTPDQELVAVEEAAAAPTEPAPPAIPQAPEERLSRPFVAPVEETPPQPQQVTRPTAPVFKPTPGAPVQDAPIPPEPAPAPPSEEAAPPVGEDAVVADITPAAPPEPEPEPVAAPEPAAPPAEPARPINPFLQRDPKQKARRLARALISDMIVYQPQKRQETLANGTLKEAFEEEIKKSWEEFVEQVGEEMANSTPFFREALNEILAGGQEIF